jgi:hypothetical protein
VERVIDAVLHRCPRDKRKLWPVAQVRPLRFHDLRHTTASLLMVAGANPAAVRILDPRITTEVYGHLAPEYLRGEIDRLRFNPKPAEPQPEAARAVANSGSFVSSLLQDPPNTPPDATDGDDEHREIPANQLARHRGFEPEVTSAPSVADRRENDAKDATQSDAKQREVSASGSVEDALGAALARASEAGRWDVVAQLAKELEARRLARAGNVVALDAAKRGR